MQVALQSSPSLESTQSPLSSSGLTQLKLVVMTLFILRFEISLIHNNHKLGTKTKLDLIFNTYVNTLRRKMK